jgi:hypothetical protein
VCYCVVDLLCDSQISPLCILKTLSYNIIVVILYYKI